MADPGHVAPIDTRKTTGGNCQIEAVNPAASGENARLQVAGAWHSPKGNRPCAESLIAALSTLDIADARRDDIVGKA
ncbi:MAG: hypothetical protein ABMA14_11480 [Hyphomonadaceae bacterium]